MVETANGMRRLLSIVTREQHPRILRLMLDEGEFLSPHGIRALSHAHRDRPYMLGYNGMEYQVRYEPAELSTGLFGGNSNWRGPVWFPVRGYPGTELASTHELLDNWRTPHEARSAHPCPRQGRPASRIPLT
jgi:hypothetical protein